jgi:hypothetical protein
MKKLILAVLVAFATGAFAQSTMKEDVDIIQAHYGKSKKELVGAYMKMEGAQSDAFWKLYDEYEVERKALGREKVRIINDYAANYSSLTDEKADELSKAAMKNNMDFEKLTSKYYDKVKGAVGAMQALKFMQLETYLQVAVRGAIQDAIPFIGELDKTKK